MADDVDIFEWAFGDGDTEFSGDNTMTHTYEKSGTYTIRVQAENTETRTKNSISRKVYVVDAKSPFAYFSLSTSERGQLEETETCNGQPAFPADRVTAINFSASESVNIDGTTSGLEYFWKVGNEKTATQSALTYRFDELGCFPVTLTVKSTDTGKSHTTRQYVSVKNILPSLSNIYVAVENIATDPLLISVTAENAQDEDGAILSYLWYYYTDFDSEPQGFRVTSLPQVTYVLPKISGKYYFAVVMEDTNGEKTNTTDAYDQQFSTPTFQAEDSLLVPIVGYSASSDSVLVGDTVQFTAQAKNVIGKDITSGAEFKWDLDGDGFYDRQTTTPSTQFVYTRPGTYNTKLKVTHR